MFIDTRTAGILRRTPHGNHMLACLIRTNLAPKAADWEPGFLANCSLPDTIHLLNGMRPRRGDVEVMWDRGLLDEGTYEEIAQELSALGDEQAKHGLRAIHLAHSNISTEAIVKLFPDASHPAQAAMMANPNCPKAYVDLGAIPVEYHLNYGEAVAKYGDIRDDTAANFLLNHVIPRTKSNQPNSRAMGARVNLAGRDGLNESMVEVLANSFESKVYSVLVENPAHAEMVQAGRIVGHNIAQLKSGDTMCLSPALRTDELEALFEDAGRLSRTTTAIDIEPESIQAVIATHKNTTRDLIDIHLKNPHGWLPGLLPRSSSPHASYAMQGYLEKHPEAFPHVSLMQDASPELLTLATERSFKEHHKMSLLGLVGQENFPWERFDIPVLRANIAESDASSLIALAAAGNRLDGQSLSTAGEDFPIEVMFSPNLSGFRLDKIAKTHKDHGSIPSLAALHPNGHDIDVELASREHREFISRCRQFDVENQLSGRASNPGIKTAAVTLEL